jgi:PhnB protein
MTLQSQLNFGGNCAEAFQYYAEHLGGNVTVLMRQKDIPGNSNLAEDLAELVIHARLSFAGTELVGNDVPADRFKPIRSNYLYCTLDSTEEADRVWAVLVDGGMETTPFGETFYATRFGQLRDRFGVLWTIIHPKPMQ